MVVQVSETLFQGGVYRSPSFATFDAQAVAHDIDTLVSVAPIKTPDTTVQIPLSDDGRNDLEEVRRAIDEVFVRVANDTRVLVYCAMGTSRSVAITAGVHALHTDISVAEALAEIDALTDTQPEPVLVDQTETAVDQLRPDTH